MNILMHFFLIDKKYFKEMHHKILSDIVATFKNAFCPFSIEPIHIKITITFVFNKIVILLHSLQSLFLKDRKNLYRFNIAIHFCLDTEVIEAVNSLYL